MELADKIAIVTRAAKGIGRLPSRQQELSSDDSDTRDDLQASTAQREYTRRQELIVWPLIIAIMVIAFYLLWTKASG